MQGEPSNNKFLFYSAILIAVVLTALYSTNYYSAIAQHPLIQYSTGAAILGVYFGLSNSYLLHSSTSLMGFYKDVSTLYFALGMLAGTLLIHFALDNIAYHHLGLWYGMGYVLYLISPTKLGSLGENPTSYVVHLANAAALYALVTTQSPAEALYARLLGVTVGSAIFPLLRDL